jgi:hypothetical protein
MSKSTCPNEAKHTPSPPGYLQWHEWALQKSRRHKQIQCPGCGLYAIWVRRSKDEPDYGGDEWMIETSERQNHRWPGSIG